MDEKEKEKLCTEREGEEKIQIDQYVDDGEDNKDAESIQKVCEDMQLAPFCLGKKPQVIAPII